MLAEGGLEEGGEAGADAGGIDHQGLGSPGAGDGGDLLVEEGVLGTRPEVAADDLVGGALAAGEDAEDGEGGGVAGIEHGLGFGLLFAGDIEGEGVGFAGDGGGQRGVLAAHEELAGGWEEAAGAGELLEFVLGADEGVIGAELGDLALHVLRVGGEVLGDLLPGDEEEAGEAVGGLQLSEVAHLAGEEGLAAPGGAHEEGGGGGGGGHGGEDGVPAVGLDILGLVGDEEERGGLAACVGGGGGGGEADGGAADAHLGLGDVEREAECADSLRSEDIEQAVSGDLGLGSERREGDDGGTAGLVEGNEEVGEELGEHLVLAALSGEDGGELGGNPSVPAAAVDDGAGDGVGWSGLVGAEGAAWEEGAGEVGRALEGEAEGGVQR